MNEKCLNSNAQVLKFWVLKYLIILLLMIKFQLGGIFLFSFIVN